jgi:hypothetical protein
VNEGGGTAGPETIARLQVILLRAALGIEPAPGQAQPLTLPDLSFLTRQDHIPVLDENIRGPIDDELRPGIRVESPEVLAQLRGELGEVAYLRFSAPEEDARGVWLSLTACLVREEPDARPVTLSGVRIRFEETDGEWQASGDPIVFAG